MYVCSNHTGAQNNMAEKFKYSDNKLKSLISGIYSGEITEYNIPEDLYHSIADYLKDGLYKGFGGTLSDFSGKDLELLSELRENIYMFSAAKSFTELQQMRDLLINSEGELKTGREFAKDAAATFENFNENWGLTERNTCITQAQSASKWNEIQKNKDLLPYLVYQTVGEGLGCDICSPLDGLTAPVDDPIWDSIAPVNHFNCECILIQEEKDNVTVTPDDEKEDIVGSVKDEISDVFKMNPGKDGYIFKDDHPYFDVQPKDREFAKENFGLPIPDAKEEIKKEIDTNPLSKKDWGKIEKHYDGYVDPIEKTDIANAKKAGLNEQEANLVINYTDRLYAVLNKEIYTDNASEMTNFVTSKLNTTLDKLPSYNGSVFRGLNPKNASEFVENLEKDGKFKFETFTSTSKDMNVAQDFLKGDQKIIFNIESKTGKSIESFSQVPEEQEVLFKSGTQFEFVSKNYMGGIHYVKLREI